MPAPPPVFHVATFRSFVVRSIAQTAFGAAPHSPDVLV
jgi:hypothetical protein